MENHPSRRAALGTLASLPALAVLPAAALASTLRLSALIEAHHAAWASFARATEALEAAEPDPDLRVSYLGPELCAIRHSSREDLISEMEVVFQFELKKLSTLSSLSPEMGKAACGALETGRAAYLAQLDEVFAGHMAAEEVWRAALAAEEGAILAICEHRCASMEEVATKVRYLADLDFMLEPNQSSAFFASFLPEGEEVEAFI